MLSPKNFDLLKEMQFCDNPNCSHYSLVGAGNIRTHSRPKAQVYCAVCKNRWVVTKGTIHFGLKTPIDKLILTLQMMAKGTGLRKTCRQQGVTTETATQWIEKAANHIESITDYMEKEMQLEQTQIDEIWKFVKNKNKFQR